MSQTLTPPPAAAGGMMGGDPMAGAGADAGGDADQDADDNVVCTITKDGQGGYLVYAGDEPEGGAGDTDDGSEDDADALGPAGAAPAPGGAAGGMGGGNGGAPQGIPADSVGAALKAALTILQADASSGDQSPDSQFAAGFGGDNSPTVSKGPAQKY